MHGDETLIHLHEFWSDAPKNGAFNLVVRRHRWSAFKDAENAVKERTSKFLSIKGSRTVDSFHRELGKIMWDKCGMARDKAGLEEALVKIPKLREEFWQTARRGQHLQLLRNGS